MAGTPHRIKEMPWPLVACACGWHYSLPQPDTWGRMGGADHLLDMYNKHRVERRAADRLS